MTTMMGQAVHGGGLAGGMLAKPPLYQSEFSFLFLILPA